MLGILSFLNMLIPIPTLDISPLVPFGSCDGVFVFLLWDGT